MARWRTRAAWLVLAALAVVGAACAAGDDEEPPAAAGPESPAPSPDAVEEPAPAPLTGSVTLRTVSLANGPVVFHPRDPKNRPAPTDEAAVARAVEATTGWLDSHLDDLRAGGRGLLDEVAADGLLEQRHVGAWRAVTGDLAPAGLVAAGYDVVVGVDGLPQWLHVTVRTHWEDGRGAAAEFVFVATDAGPVLVAAGPEGGVSP